MGSHTHTKIGIGDFAICQKGELGLILWEKVCVDKRTKKKYILYHGINLNPDKIGLNWQSRNPTKVNKSYVKKMFKPKSLVGGIPRMTACRDEIMGNLEGTRQK